jgi:hypothetical protein
MKRTITAILAALSILLGAPLAAVADIGVSVEFSDEEVRIIGAWYEERGAGNDNAKSRQKGKRLPPGIAKNLARGKPLPPGIAKQQLPDGLVHALPGRRLAATSALSSTARYCWSTWRPRSFTTFSPISCCADLRSGRLID